MYTFLFRSPGALHILAAPNNRDNNSTFAQHYPRIKSLNRQVQHIAHIKPATDAHSGHLNSIPRPENYSGISTGWVVIGFTNRRRRRRREEDAGNSRRPKDLISRGGCPSARLGASRALLVPAAEDPARGTS